MRGAPGTLQSGAMKIRFAFALAACCALCGCTDADWLHVMNFVGLDDTRPMASRPAPKPVARTVPRPVAPAAQTAQVNGVNPFCASVARQDSENNGFDAQTQQSVFVRSYQQCVSVFGNTAQ